MAQSIKLADDIMTSVRREAELQSRSLAGQVAHWVKIARAVERSGTFDYRRIEDALEARLSPDELTGDEQDVWFAEFGDATAKPSDGEADFFAERRRLGHGVGMNDQGDLVRQPPKT